MSDTKGAASADSSIPSDPPPVYTAAAEHEPAAAPDGSAAAASGRPRIVPPPRKPPPPMDLPILAHLRSRRVILASASPRRKQLLAQVGLTKLEIWPSSKPEDLSKTMYGPFEYVSETAHRKCLDVYQEVLKSQEEEAELAAAEPQQHHPVAADPELVIAADTIIVTRAGQILEKPRSAQDHVKMLRHLRDTDAHRVLTAVCVLSPRQDAAHPGYSMASHTEETKVVFVKQSEGLSDAVIDSYVRTREGADKAGGYAVQGTGGLLLVSRIEGNLDNVIGLPVRQCLRLAEKVIFKQNEEEEADEDSEDE
ncbi:septum formation protein [Sporothrix schenckii 1099-18]|uniref:Septum formation protein Maf n=2 Tax=Sporothrix schenckii TaxID=29908 RepID=U7PM33_SPOS1|nr:septum formation protein [Sporothrix schenckii 1099-18]ERS95971.1 septum formation protein Maf [Sporothrix schenckii ATCC 58251]KJR81777.1 septum formation protein [Sporothrix schenckii 1099-18]